MGKEMKKVLVIESCWDCRRVPMRMGGALLSMAEGGLLALILSLKGLKLRSNYE